MTKRFETFNFTIMIALISYSLMDGKKFEASYCVLEESIFSKPCPAVLPLWVKICHAFIIYHSYEAKVR